MSIFGALFSGVSGLGAQAQAMGMLADNITNVNTTGYKETSARFSSLVTATTVITKHSPGGVQSAPQQVVDKQGLLTVSASPTDLAINGQGFMIVSGVSSPTAESQQYLTRAGSFTADKDGYLRNAGGYYLRGWEYPTGATSADKTTLKTVKITDFPSTWQATSAVSVQANLKASQTLSAAAITYDGSASASNMASGTVAADFTRGVEITDSLGSPRTLTFNFLKANRTALAAGGGADTLTITSVPTPTAYEAGQMFRFTAGAADNTGATTLNVDGLGAKALESSGVALAASDLVAGTTYGAIYDGTAFQLAAGGLANLWNVEVSVNPSSITTGAVDGQVMRGTIGFNSDGTWDSGTTYLTTGVSAATTATITPVSGDYSASIPFDSGTLGNAAQTIAFDLGTNAKADKMSQFDGTSNLVSTTVDGAQVGDLASISVNDQGILSAVFKNGISENKYQLPVGTVPNPNGLSGRNGNVYVVTSMSGDLTRVDAGSNAAGLYAPASLESSTVDLLNEFAKMILAQRSFSAAARIVSTSDAMLEELIRIKR
jgi:flagellar hook protein FlgE